MVPLYYRFIRLLWVGASMQPSLVIPFLQGNENDLYSETHVELGNARSMLPAKGLWGPSVRGVWRRKLPGSPCSLCISEVWTLLLVFLRNTVWMSTTAWVGKSL